ncbi:MAG: AhpC/TSA family protein [Prevotella sp.]|nr:AhpC/TSA family protein [Prevotella sp.]MBR3480837.1 AhpC/TSA family protein [Prevotella sp.]
MKKIIITGLMALVIVACTDNKQFTVEGTIEGAQDSTLYLYNQSLSGPELMDSVKLGSDGKFSFKSDAPDAPDFYVLLLHNQIINFSIDSTETVTINAKYPGMGSNYTVTGSDNCEKIRQLALLQQDLQRRAMALERNGSLTQQQRLDSLQTMVNEYKDITTQQYIYVEPQKAYAYFALFQTLGQWNLYERSNPQDMKAFGAVATCWDTYYPEALRTEYLRNIALKGMNEQRAIMARQNTDGLEGKIVNAGLIELQLPDASGNIRTLTELAGKVVLLDFHSFGLKDSAARILELRELYNKYHAQGLEIYQVSIDGDEHFWKQQTEHLPWICVFDPNATSLPSYNVQEVPEFFTIDREGLLQKRSVQMADGVEEEIRRLL